MTTAPSASTLATEPLTPTIGTVVRDVDLRRVDDVTVAAIRAALVQRKVLFFRGQSLEPADLVTFAARFGALTPAHPVMPSLENHPEVLEVDATRSRLDPRYHDEYENDTWHADVTFMPTPPLGSVLHAVTVPEAGGDTAWADQERAYETLSEPIKRLIEPLHALHDGNGEFGRFLAGNDHGGQWDGERFTELTPVVHPVVRTHPETRRRSLFVNPTFTTRIVELNRRESAHLLALLFEHASALEHVVRHRWATGDVAMWDNRSTMHYAIRDYDDGVERVLHRVTIRGDRPF